MSSRILTFGAVASVVISAAIANLALLDMITIDELKETLGRTLLVVAVSTIAVAAVASILKTGRRRSDPPHEAGT